MSTQYFDRYLKQKSILPANMRAYVEVENKDRVSFYALSDLDSNFERTEKWIVVGNNKLYVFQGEGKSIFSLENLKIREGHGRVANHLTLLSENDDLLDVFWYGQKQNILFAQLKYILEEGAGHITISADENYQQSVLAPLLKNQASTEIGESQVVMRLLKYLMPYKKEVVLGTIGAVGLTLVSLFPAYISGRLLDEVIKPFQDGTLSGDEAVKIGVLFIVTLGLIYLLKQFFIWLRLKKMSVMGEKVARDLREDLFTHIQKLDMDFFSTKHTGTIISRVSSDTDRIWDFVAFGVVEVSIAILTMIGLSAVLISLDWQLGLMMTVPVPIIIWAIYHHGEKMKRMFIRCWRKWSELTAVVGDTVPGIQVVKSFNQEKKEINRFNQKNQAALDEFNEVHEAWTKFWPGLFLIVHAIMVIVWAMAVPRLLSMPNEAGYMSAGTFVSFLLYMTMFTQPIEVIGQMARMLNRASSSAYRVFEILDTKPSLNTDESVVRTKLQGQIEFRDVIFSYDGVRNVLKGISFEIKAGEMIGLVGPSGSGKSTITKLMNRFYDVSSGGIYLDGLEIKSLEVGSLRSQIAVVHQDPYLFHGSILDNITYGNDKASLDQVIQACRAANAHEFILNFKDGYDTKVGERGQTLSGGERQRISIARAILNDPRILILDEATSAVDTETERKIQDALDRLVEGRTVIAIAHRLSTLRKANRIFVVKDGKLDEVGTHAELMANGGEYKKLQDMQTEMFNLMHG